VDDGLDGLVVRPTLAIAGAANGLDRALHAAVLGTGSRVLELAAMAWRLDHVIHDTVLDVGRWTLGLAGMAWRLDRVISALVDAVGTVALILARASRLSDETGIEALIASVVTGT